MRGISGVSLVIAGVILGVSLVVGERAPSPSPGVPTATARADSEAAPARSLAGGNGEDGGGRHGLPIEALSGAVAQWPEGSQWGDGRWFESTQRPITPASTVTQSALTGEGGAATGDPIYPFMPTRPTVTVSPTGGGAYIAPATPVATSRAVETIAPKSINSYDPWPAYLWPVVECLIQRESKGDPYAVGLAGERGLLQVHPITWGYLSRFGITPDALFDPATNIRAAYLLYIEAGGLRPWGGGCA